MPATETQPAPSANPAAPSHRSFAALRDRGFLLYFLYSALAMMADSIEHAHAEGYLDSTPEDRA